MVENEEDAKLETEVLEDEEVCGDGGVVVLEDVIASGVEFVFAGAVGLNVGTIPVELLETLEVTDCTDISVVLVPTGAAAVALLDVSTADTTTMT